MGLSASRSIRDPLHWCSSTVSRHQVLALWGDSGVVCRYVAPLATKYPCQSAGVYYVWFLDIEVKPGWRKGTKIRFAGLGNERAPPLAPQDVLFVVDEVPHARFRREGANLFTTCDINLLDALGDTKHVIQGLDGNNIVVDVGSELAGGIIRPGDVSRVVGMGMPVRRNSQVVGAGDLIIK